jgi:hypothetical protein
MYVQPATNPRPASLSHLVNSPYPSLHPIPPPTSSWTYYQRVHTTPAGKDRVAANLQGGKFITQQKQTRRRYSSTCCSAAIDSDIHKLFISGIVPRPIAFVSTISGESIENLVLFRYQDTPRYLTGSARLTSVRPSVGL